MTTNNILTAEEEIRLRQPIEEQIGEIQKKIDALRVDGTDRILSLRNHISLVKEDKLYSRDEVAKIIAQDKEELKKAEEIEQKNRAQEQKLIAEGEAYLAAHFDQDYYSKVALSCAQEKEEAARKYNKTLADLKAEHEKQLAACKDAAETKDENYVYKNKKFDAKMTYDAELERIKTRKHDAFSYRYHLIDLLRLSRFTLPQKFAQWKENYFYTFNRVQFL